MSAIRSVQILNIKGQRETLRLEKSLIPNEYMICRDTEQTPGAAAMKVQGREKAIATFEAGVARLVATGATIVSEG